MVNKVKKMVKYGKNTFKDNSFSEYQKIRNIVNDEYYSEPFESLKIDPVAKGYKPVHNKDLVIIEDIIDILKDLKDGHYLLRVYGLGGYHRYSQKDIAKRMGLSYIRVIQILLEVK